MINWALHRKQTKPAAHPNKFKSCDRFIGRLPKISPQTGKLPDVELLPRLPVTAK